MSITSVFCTTANITMVRSSKNPVGWTSRTYKFSGHRLFWLIKGMADSPVMWQGWGKNDMMYYHKLGA